MEPVRWRQIEDIFDRALEQPDASRAKFLEAACGGDRDLLREVHDLLASTAEASSSIRQLVSSEAGRLAIDVGALPIGRRIGPYRVRELIGEGGMGAVYLATRDDEQFDQEVAIKILPHAVGSPQAIARFRDERQMLAALDHPNIVRLLDGGTTDDGLPYLVMEHIAGKAITTYARERGPSVQQRIELVREVCGAIQYAHGNLIVHRDIKPSNILVDAHGTPKLLDFGIAKLVAPTTGRAREAKTRTGAALFTPEYASPEQARGETVSTATDVYSVGAVLYELVTDQPPLRASSSILETLRIINEVDPERPSAVAPSDRRRELAGDLDNIILKALHKEPARRYASVEQLSDDLARYLEGLPVHARVATLGYRTRKFVRRNRAAVIAAALVASALVGGTVIALRQAQRADAQAIRADEAAETARAETARAKVEAERARAAESKVQAQLDEIRREQGARALAELQAREKTSEAQMTREQLVLALEKAQKEKLLAEQESRRAREAEERAAKAAATERKTREEAQALYQREKALSDERANQGKKIQTRLR